MSCFRIMGLFWTADQGGGLVEAELSSYHNQLDISVYINLGFLTWKPISLRP